VKLNRSAFRFETLAASVPCSALIWLVCVCTPLVGADHIVPSPKLPPQTPWNLEQLSQPPQFEWVDSRSPVKSLYYIGEPYHGKQTRVFAYFASPATLDSNHKDGERYPAVVLLHGGGGTAFRDWVQLWAKRGYAAIAMDLAGSRPIENKKKGAFPKIVPLIDGGPGQGMDTKFGSIDQAPSEQWTYHAVAAAVRAHSLIRTFPEVNAERTGVTGISWGGYLTLIVAAVDSRFKVAVPVYGCGYLHENSAWLKQLNKMTPEQRDRWVKLWDPSVYVPAIQSPILLLNGTNDFAYPLDSYMKTWAAISSTKQLRITAAMPHSHQDGWAPKEIGLFVGQYLRGEKPLLSLSTPIVANGGTTFKCTSGGKYSAKLNFTNEKGPINKRIWHTQSITMNNDCIRISSLPIETTAWYVTVADDRDATVSSEVYFP
jgi:dienelactone hydrolase